MGGYRNWFCNNVLLPSIQTEFHYDSIIARSVIILSQTSFFKTQFAVKAACCKIRSPHFEGHETRFSPLCFPDSVFHQTGTNPCTPSDGTNRDIQDVAFVRNEPSTQITDNRLGRAVASDCYSGAGKWQR